MADFPRAYCGGDSCAGHHDEPHVWRDPADGRLKTCPGDEED